MSWDSVFFGLSLPWCFFIGGFLAPERMMSCRCTPLPTDLLIVGNSGIQFVEHSLYCDTKFIEQYKHLDSKFIGQCARVWLTNEIDEWFQYRASDKAPDTHFRNYHHLSGVSKIGKTHTVFFALIRAYIAHAYGKDARVLYLKLSSSTVNYFLQSGTLQRLYRLAVKAPDISFIIILDESNHLLTEANINEFAGIIKQLIQETQNVLLFTISEHRLEREYDIFVNWVNNVINFSQTPACVAHPTNEAKIQHAVKNYYSDFYKRNGAEQGFLNLIQWTHYRIMMFQELELLFQQDVMARFPQKTNPVIDKLARTSKNFTKHYALNLDIREQAKGVDSAIQYLKKLPQDISADSPEIWTFNEGFRGISSSEMKAVGYFTTQRDLCTREIDTSQFKISPSESCAANMYQRYLQMHSSSTKDVKNKNEL